MKSLLSICKIFSCCFLVVYTFSSCKTTLRVYGKDVPKKVIITITGFDTAKGNLTMKDEKGMPADTIQVWPGQIIKWRIKGSGINSIDSILAKRRNEITIFAEEPHEEFLSTTWKGKIKDEGAIKENGVRGEGDTYNYDYNIYWKLTKKGKIYTYDPRIQVK